MKDRGLPKDESNKTKRSLGKTEPRIGKIRSISRHGFHKVSYREWGDRSAPDRVICVHGLTRNSHDFDPLALSLSERAHVICPDLVGRGESDWLSDPADYHLLQYNMDMTVLTASFGDEQVDWIGTSLGGLIGIALAGLEKTPIRRLVVNDIAPEVPYSALARIRAYAGQQNVFDSVDSVEHHLRETLSPFAPMTDADWHRMALTSCFETVDGYQLHHDPEIMQNFRRYFMFMHFNLWKFWDRIQCPVLILRGTESDFLTSYLLEKMTDRLPQAEFIEFDGVGHTPTLNSEDQMRPIRDWLSSS